ncbi:MAG: hypothetical protein Q7R56_01930 [Nanoarchaeota archaeon]|nr:hypothetical protein [Nanoarchaeota archaeon]
MHKEKLTIDYDGVLYDFVTPFLAVVKKRTGKIITLADITCYSFAETLGLPETTINDMIAETVDRHALPLLPQAVAICEQLSQTYELIIVTSRNETWKKQTQQPIEQDFPQGVISDIYFTTNGNSPRLGHKDELLQRLKPKAHLEDGLHFAEQIATKGIHTLLFDWPWNQHPKELPYIKRTQPYQERAHWEQVPSLLQQL